VLDALLTRAAGDDAEELGLEALALARVVGEEEALLEIHLLLCETYRGRGDSDAARSHLAQAIALREQVTTGLPPEVTAAFHARKDVAQIARLEGLLAGDVPARESHPPTSSAKLPGPVSLEGARKGASVASRAGAVELVGVDPVMRGLYATIKKVARSSSTVLIRGESGTGKELVAAALHRASDRAAGPMVTVNCAALVETLLLSELFGHEKGAFTGATARRRGRFELAEGGTLFLDEIGDISPKTQVALLRVLQERTFERVGGTAPIRVDVHIICATHRDLRAMVERGEFREDLYYRLRGITLEVPALRARPSDLPALADHLLGRIAGERGEGKKSLSPSALELLALHRWPGNVRELENALRAASLFTETDIIGEAHITDNVDDLRATAQKAAIVRNQGQKLANDTVPMSSALPSSATFPVSSSPDGVVVRDDSSGEGVALDGEDGGDWDAPLPSDEASATAIAYAQVRQGALSLSDLKRQIERDCIARALAETKGNITKAAALLGMKRPRLSQLVKQYGLAAAMSEAQ
jgi:transcriptional regulator with GAF, ATPase, and Fis domain